MIVHCGRLALFSGYFWWLLFSLAFSLGYFFPRLSAPEDCFLTNA